MGNRGWLLLFLPLFLLLSPAGGENPWEGGCPKPKPKPKPGKGKVRGHCSLTCHGNKWVERSCAGVQGPELCGNFCGVGLCSPTNVFADCGFPVSTYGSPSGRVFFSLSFSGEWALFQRILSRVCS